MRLTLIGATGGTGQELLRQAIADGHHVLALARRPEVITQKSPLLRVVHGDVLDPDTLPPVLENAEA